jgi:hypothetical protein
MATFTVVDAIYSPDGAVVTVQQGCCCSGSPIAAQTAVAYRVLP